LGAFGYGLRAPTQASKAAHMPMPRAIANSLPRVLYTSGLVAAFLFAFCGAQWAWNEYVKGHATERNECSILDSRVVSVWNGPFAVDVEVLVNRHHPAAFGWTRLPRSEVSSHAEAAALGNAATRPLAAIVECFVDPADMHHVELDPRPRYRMPALLLLAAIGMFVVFGRRVMREARRLTWDFHTDGMRPLNFAANREKLPPEHVPVLSPELESWLETVGFRRVGCILFFRRELPTSDVYAHGEQTAFASPDSREDIRFSTLLEDGTVVETRRAFRRLWWVHLLSRYGPNGAFHHPAAGYEYVLVRGEPSPEELWQAHRARTASVAARRKTIIGPHIDVWRYLAIRRRAWDVNASRIRWVFDTVWPAVAISFGLVALTARHGLTPRACFAWTVATLVGMPVVWTQWLGPLVMWRLPVLRRVPAPELVNEEAEVQEEQKAEVQRQRLGLEARIRELGAGLAKGP